MLNIDRQGTIAIRQGNENQEPMAVYVGGVNGFYMLVCKPLNSGSLYFSMPEEDDLVDFDFKLLQKLRAEWNVENAKRSVVKFQKNLDEVYV